MAQVARPACTGSRLGAHLQGGARVIRCCGEKLGGPRGGVDYAAGPGEEPWP
jgi:hypothetical protein